MERISAQGPSGPARADGATRKRSSGRRRDQTREARRGLYRQLLLDAAETAFARQGIAQTKMEELAEAAGPSLGTVYSVYRGKAEIVDALHEARLREIFAASLIAEREEPKALDSLVAGVRAYVGYFLDRPDYLRMYVEDGTSWGVRASMAHHPRRAAVWSDGIAQLAAIFERGMQEGVFERGDPDRMARMMIAMQQVQLADWLEEGMARAPDLLISEIEAQVRRSFCKGVRHAAS